jgi:hypothetical protein
MCASVSVTEEEKERKLRSEFISELMDKWPPVFSKPVVLQKLKGLCFHALS